MDLNKLAHIDTNYGVDFERAKERLNAEAGRLFRKYHALKTDAGGTPAEVEEAREAYITAQDQYRKIHPMDFEAIAVQLGPLGGNRSVAHIADAKK